MPEPVDVIEIAPERTHDLRRRVLRVDTPSDTVEWPGDRLPSTLHLGVERAGDLVGISTWLVVSSPDAAADSAGWQLRGMATDPTVRGLGIGRLLLLAGIGRARRAGADHVWANARCTVLPFYTEAGFEIVSDEFESADTAIAHRRILLSC